MGQKTNNRILWHGNGLNAEGKAVAPVKAVAGGDGTDGLNEGELYICNSDSDPALFILTDAGNVVRIDGNGSDTYTREQINEKLNAKVDVAFFSSMFGLIDEEGGEIQVNDVETLASSIKAKLGFWTEQYLSAKGKNPDSGSEVSGATTLAALTDVSITTTPKDGQVLAYDITMNKWTPVDMEATAGIDEEELLQILTQKGYATQQWVTQQSYAKTSVRIKAGTGLTGGGTLAQDVTLSLATVGTAGTYTKVTVDSYGRVTGHSTLTQGDIPALAISKITGLQTALDAKLNKSVFEELFEKVWVSGYGYAIRAKLAFYSDDWISAKGLNSDAGSTTGGVDKDEVLQIVENAGYIKSSALNGYATQSWVRGLGYATQTWVNSQGYLTQDTADGRYYYGHNEVDTSFNNATAGGGYYVVSNRWPSDGPDSSYRYGALAVFNTDGGGNRLAQLYISHHSTGGVYTRMFYDSWSEWRRLLDDYCINDYALTPSNYTDYTVTKTGGGASGTWGIGITGNAGTATRLATARTIWGKSFDGTGNVDGNITVNFGYVFLNHGWFQNNQSGFGLYNQELDARWYATTNGWTSDKLIIGTVGFSTGGYVQIGSAVLRYDSSNNALYVQNADGTACGFYATGFVSAKGANSSSGSAVAGVTELAGLDDVAISSPVNGQALVYRNGIWKNETVSGGGTASVAWADVTGKPTWIPDTDGSGSGIDADLLDGTHKSGLFTAMTYLGSTLSLTIGGVRKTVNIETSAVVPTVSVSSTSSRNLSVNVGGSTDYVNDLYATYSTYADFLRTARTIWGQSFNGGSSVSGALTGVTTITASGNIKGSAFFLTTGGGLYYVNGTTYLDGREGENFQIRTSGGTSIPTLTIYATTTKFNGTAYATGGFQNGSDIRYKHVLQDLALTVAQVAAAPSFLFRWTDGTADGVQAGTSAQYWQQVLPQVVTESAGRLSMQYDKAALAAAIATARAVADHETRIRRLEQQLDKTPASTP